MPTDLTQSDRELIEAVRDGAETTTEMADALGLDKGHVQRMAKELHEDGYLNRERTGPGYAYSAGEELRVEDGGTSAVAVNPSPESDSLIPVVRDYDFSGNHVTEPPEYFASGDELREVKSIIKHREMHGENIRIMVEGHSGTGKTVFAENVAAWLDAPLFTLQMSPDVTAKQMFGMPILAGDESMWVDGPATKALMASADTETQRRNGWGENDGPAVLFIDEYNRAPPRMKNALFSALDHRGEVRLDGPRGGEIISGNALDLIIIATVNEGSEYHGTMRMDHAENTRWTYGLETDYLASSPSDEEGIETEAELLVERKGLPASIARKLSTVASEVREKSADPNNTQTDIRSGIPTRTVLAWGAWSMAFSEDGYPDPVVRAGKRAVKRIYSDPGDEAAFNEVVSDIEDHFLGVGLDPDELRYAEDDEMARCTEANCEWSAPKSKAEEMGVLIDMACPECGTRESVIIRSR